jgi:uncharacterized membrane protein YbaN (DUF454 family)
MEGDVVLGFVVIALGIVGVVAGRLARRRSTVCAECG